MRPDASNLQITVKLQPTVRQIQRSPRKLAAVTTPTVRQGTIPRISRALAVAACSTSSAPSLLSSGRFCRTAMADGPIGDDTHDPVAVRLCQDGRPALARFVLPQDHGHGPPCWMLLTHGDGLRSSLTTEWLPWLTCCWPSG